MWAPSQVQPPPSLLCWREVLSSQPGALSPVPGQKWPSQEGPKPDFQPSLPSLCKFENPGPSMGPGQRGRQAGRTGFGILWSADCDPGLVAACPGPQFPT